jgi:hypothetical protein
MYKMFYFSYSLKMFAYNDKNKCRPPASIKGTKELSI